MFHVASAYLSFVLIDSQRYGALFVGPHQYDVNLACLPRQMISIHPRRRDFLGLKDALLCSYCLCLLMACTNSARVRATLRVVSIKFSAFTIALTKQGV